MPSVVIVGGGISGLSAAYYLLKAGVPSTIFEARPRLGGVIQTERIRAGDGECLIEAGPDSFLSAKPWALDLIRELGLEGEVIGSNDSQRKTYIRKRGRMVAFPDGLQLVVPTRVWPMVTTPLVGWRTKLKMGLEWFRRPRSGARDRSVAEFVEDHYGREAVDYLAEPLLSGIYGGDPAELSVTSVLGRLAEMEVRYGSLTRGTLAALRKASGNAVPLFRTLRGGLGTLVDALESAVRQGVTVQHASVEAIEGNGTGFRLRAAGGWLEADKIVLACEAHQAARLTAAIGPRMSSLLAAISYTSSMTAALGFRRSEVQREMRGFGFLVPARERKYLLAGTWIGNKFPFRVPEPVAVLRCFVGGAGAEKALAGNDDSVLESVRGDLREMLGIGSEPLFTRIYRWPRSMAQYTVGHGERMAQIEECLAAAPNLFIAGNGYRGIGLPDCVRMGKQAAEKISKQA